MKVLLVHVDGVMPNLALMKISAFHKRRGDEVYLKRGLSPVFPLSCPNPDKIYLSCIFEKNRSKALKLAEKFRSEVEIGGYGVNDKKLLEGIEHIRPDYSLYGIDYSMGFTSRGCFRRCPWCIVPEKEGDLKDHASINEFLHPNHKKLILFDNNFLASPKWRENLIKIIAYRLKVNFNQGLDIRLINEENARLLSHVQYSDWKFKNKHLHFAFDLPQIEKEVLEGIETLKKAGIPPNHLIFYILVGFKTSFEEDMHRIKLLASLGAKPYVMPYNDRKDSYYPHLERWVNRLYYQMFPFEEYKKRHPNG